MQIQKKKTVDISLQFWPHGGMHKFYYQIISPANIAIVNTQFKKGKHISMNRLNLSDSQLASITIRMSSKKHRVFLSANIIYYIVLWKAAGM